MRADLGQHLPSCHSVRPLAVLSRLDDYPSQRVLMFVFAGETVQ